MTELDDPEESRVIASSGSSESPSDGVADRLGHARPGLLERPVVLYSALGVSVAFGLAFRAIQYAADRSLWFDESMLALNILHRSAAGLTRTLDFAQAAPLGFLELEKLATHLFADSELSLRLLPLICGLASVPLFAALALRVLRPAPALLATLVFSCAAGPVYYASEVKQYSGDLAVTIGLILLAALFLDETLSGRTRVVASLAATAAMLLSHASIFVASGIALAFAVRALVRRDRSALDAFAATVPWVLMGVFVVVFTSERTTRLEAVIGGSSSGVYGHGASVGSKLSWIRDVASSLVRSMGYGGSLERYLHWPVLVLALAGALGFARRRPALAGVLLLPFAVTWTASELNKYPVFDRTVLFLVPATVLLVAEGAVVLARAARSPLLRLSAAGILAAGMLLVPLVHAFQHTGDPQQHEEIKKVLVYIRSHWQPGDVLFVDRGARFALRYYLDCDCFGATRVHGPGLSWGFGERRGVDGHAPVPLRSVYPRFVVGRLDVRATRAFASQLHGFAGRARVWIVYTHLSYRQEAQVIAATLRRLDRAGRRLAAFGAPGAHAYLYDLRPRSS